MKKDEETKGAGEVKEASKGHEIATIKIPGIESGDRAAQEMVNQQAKAKKELNAELKEHAGHSDHLAPSEIVGHSIAHNLPDNRAIDTILSMPDKGLGEMSGAMTDPVTREQVIAKSELNAEIKTYAGEKKDFTDHIVPSEIADSLPHGERLSGFDSASDPKTRDHILAKKSLNAEIKQQARIGHTDFIMPSEIHARDRLAGLGAMNDDVMKDHILAKKEVNAVIKELMGHSDHIVPSEVAAHEIAAHDAKMTTPEAKQRSDRLKGEMHYQQAKEDTAIVSGAYYTPTEATEASPEAMEASPEEATPEVTEAPHHLSTSQKIKEKVKDAAHAMKETLKNLH